MTITSEIRETIKTKEGKEWNLELAASTIRSSVGTISFKNSVDINGAIH
jgi:hypothetical protein